MLLGDILGAEVVNSLQKRINTGYVLPKMSDPEKGSKLHEDYRWVDFHMNYIDSVKNVFKLSMTDATAESPVFLNVNTPILVNAYVNDSSRLLLDKFMLGYHVNCALLRAPTVFIEKSIVDSLEKYSKLLRKSGGHSPGEKEYVKYLKSRNSFSAYDVMSYYMLSVNDLFVSNHEINWVGNQPYYTYEHLRDSFMTVGSDEDLSGDELLGFAKDVQSYKVRSSTITPDNVKVLRHNGKSYYMIPLFPKGFSSISRPIISGAKAHSIYWEILQ